MSSRPPLVVLRGSSPIVLVAPHAGRRDAARRPWGSALLKMNDLHTGALAHELAGRLDASAVVNDGGDRNDVDLNRVTAAHDRAPHFLDALATLVDAAVARHGRAVVLTIHGWNVVQPAVDLGLGTSLDAESFRLAPGGAVSEHFATTTLAALAGALAARDIVATPGLRYAARARENLLQLFTPRYLDDPRPLVRRLAALGTRTDAVQLELALPLRLPGSWRDRFLDACTAALGTDADGSTTHAPWPAGRAATPARLALEFVSEGMSGLAALDDGGGRLLLFPDDGSLLLFTGERVGAHDPHRVAGLSLGKSGGGVVLEYDGPLLRFPDTTPFVDLERGLAAAALVDGSVRLTLEPTHHDDAGEACPFGVARGRVVAGDHVRTLAGHGVRVQRDSLRTGRPRAGLRLDDRRCHAIAGPDAGFVCEADAHVPLTRGWLDTHAAAPGAVRIGAETVGGERIAIEARLAHRLPVVRGGPTPGRTVFAACRIATGLAGWIELPGG